MDGWMSQGIAAAWWNSNCFVIFLWINPMMLHHIKAFLLLLPGCAIIIYSSPIVNFATDVWHPGPWNSLIFDWQIPEHPQRTADRQYALTFYTSSKKQTMVSVHLPRSVLLTLFLLSPSKDADMTKRKWPVIFSPRCLDSVSPSYI